MRRRSGHCQALLWLGWKNCLGVGAGGGGGVEIVVGQTAEDTSDGGISFLTPISGEPCPHLHPPVPQGLWVRMYPRLQVGAGCVGSRVQA